MNSRLSETPAPRRRTRGHNWGVSGFGSAPPYRSLWGDFAPEDGLWRAETTQLDDL
jgi:hypothetical protein